MTNHYGRYTPQVMAVLADISAMTQDQVEALRLNCSPLREDLDATESAIYSRLPKDEWKSMHKLAWRAVKNWQTFRGSAVVGLRAYRAVLALILKDRITSDQFSVMTAHWRRVFGDFDFSQSYRSTE